MGNPIKDKPMIWGWFIPPIEGALGDGLWHWAYHIIEVVFWAQKNRQARTDSVIMPVAGPVLRQEQWQDVPLQHRIAWSRGQLDMCPSLEGRTSGNHPMVIKRGNATYETKRGIYYVTTSSFTVIFFFTCRVSVLLKLEV